MTETTAAEVTYEIPAGALHQALNAGADPPDAETLRRIASVLDDAHPADGEGE